MAWIAIGAAAISAAPAIYKGIKGIGQSNAAGKINPTSPGYVMNQGIIDNARTLSDQYGNYQLPGYGQIAGNINSTFANAFGSGVKGASSSNDVLDLATKMAYGKNQAYNQLGEENAQGKQSILGSYLDANAQAGQQQVDKNAYDNAQYQQALRQKAALTQAGAENTFGSIDQLAGIAGKYGFSQAGSGSGTSTDPNNPATSSLNPALKANRQINSAYTNSIAGNPYGDTGAFTTQF